MTFKRKDNKSPEVILKNLCRDKDNALKDPLVLCDRKNFRVRNIFTN